jgi:peptide/nickel transport system substrate-binding protein
MNGQIDFVGVYMDVALTLEAQNIPGLSVAYSPSQNSVLYIGGNYNDPNDLSKPHPVLGSKEVRKAIMHAIDRDALNYVVFGGKHQLAHTWIASPRHPLYSMEGVITYDYNPTKAKQILADAGWKAGSDGILVKDGVRAVIENVSPANSAPHEQAQMMIRDYLRAVGIEYKPNNMPWSTFSANFRRYRKFDTMMGDWGWNVFSEADGFFTSELIPSDGNAWAGLNYYGWSNAESDRLVRLAATETDPAKRKEYYKRHLQIFSDELPIMPLLVYMNATVYKSKMMEFNVPGLDPGSFENSFRWYFER